MLKIRLFPILVLLLGVALTFIISYSALKDMRELSRREFEDICQNFENKIQIQLKANAQILYSSAAYVSSSEAISREEWREFQFLNKSYREVPGIRGIGYSVVVPKDQLNQFEQQIRKEGFPDFKVRPEGDRDFYTAVLLIEPFSNPNLSALGYDGFTEPIRRKAMEMSFLHDRATISDKVVLVQDSVAGRQPGTIMFVPVFKKGMPRESSKQQKEAILGWVFSPFRMSTLLTGILGQWDYQSVRLKVYDEILNKDNLLFDSDTVFNVQRTEKKLERYRLPLDFNGKVWVLDFFEYQEKTRLFSLEIIIVLLKGISISILLFILAFSLINARAKSLRIQMLNDELKKVNINKDRFISVLAHDLKTPFNTMLGFSELLAENFSKLKKEELEEYINQVNMSAKSTYELLEELLMWARVQSGQFPFNPEKLNLNDLCRHLVNDHTLIAGRKSITVSTDVPENLIVVADELMLKTILRNLVVNAIKFTRENGWIRISATKTEEKAVISVSDTGVGMSFEDRSKLFDITKVYSKSGTANEKGTGMGLLLCKELVAKHGGEIEVESTLGKGSMFRFTVSLAK